MPKFQINMSVTLLEPKKAKVKQTITDQEWKEVLGLEDDETVGFDVRAIAAEILKALESRDSAPTHRSANGNLTVSIPLKVEGKFIKKTALVEKKVAQPSNTKEKLLSELKAELL